ncbi:Peptidase_S10 domain-containing protein [Cephalotus follicularis]|uniref:Peptidase_S10 domain-containing protein n=1 Tax=Cephalotus follicularis TaxID=3775 RepID=A0A1Q3AM36_CEPFO|nr:Peptidase_S10 domain-containing protein [Cephalotus follicularis]
MAKSNIAIAKVCFLILSHVCSQYVVSHTMVKFLPGFEGPLPFQLETGYVGVDESEDVQLFYYFVKSERNPKEDPLLIWLTGGPGCSTLSALLYEIGPLKFNVVEYTGSLPTLLLNPNSWTKVSSIIFVDSPVGTGFSYARSQHASQTGDLKQVHHLRQFLMKWLMVHPEFLSNQVYLGGDSYSGLTVPVLIQEISKGNEEGANPLINMQGYVLGNPITVPTLESNSAIPFAHGMGLISDELYESLRINCGGEYQTIDPSNEECLNDLLAYHKSISGINSAHILEPVCAFASRKPQEMSKRSLIDQLQGFVDPEPTLPTIGCRTYGYLLSHYWVNDENVRKALHIQEGSIGKWLRCNYGIPYTTEISNSFPFHVNLSAKGYRSLIYTMAIMTLLCHSLRLKHGQEL